MRIILSLFCLFFSVFFAEASEPVFYSELREALDTGSLAAVEDVLSRATDARAKKAINDTGALIIASERGCFEVVALFLEKGAKVTVKRQKDGITALHAASKMGHLKIVKLLLEYGADADMKGTKEYKEKTPLFEASAHGHEEIVEFLLESGADVNMKRRHYGITPIYAAAGNGHKEIVRLLMEKGADANIPFSAERPEIALYYAIDCDKIEVVKLLWATRPPTFTDVQNKKLVSAATSGRIEIVKFLLENVSFKADLKNRALLEASRNGQTEVVKILLEAGANVEYTGPYYQAVKATAIYAAIQNGHIETARFLIENDRVFLKGHSQFLAEASEMGATEIVKLLLEKSVKAKADINYQEAIALAKKGGHEEIVRMLELAEQEHRSRLDEAAYFAIKDSKSMAELLLFLKEHPDSPYVTDVRNRMKLCSLKVLSDSVIIPYEEFKLKPKTWEELKRVPAMGGIHIVRVTGEVIHDDFLVLRSDVVIPGNESFDLRSGKVSLKQLNEMQYVFSSVDDKGFCVMNFSPLLSVGTVITLDKDSWYTINAVRFKGSQIKLDEKGIEFGPGMWLYRFW